MTDADRLNEIREHLNVRGIFTPAEDQPLWNPWADVRDLVAAYDEKVAALSDAEQRAAELQHRLVNQKTNVDALYRQRRAAEQERDEALEALEGGAYTAKPSNVEAIKHAEAAEGRATKLETALAECLRFAPGGVDEVPERHAAAVEAWIRAWELIEGTDADWRVLADLAAEDADG